MDADEANAAAEPLSFNAKRMLALREEVLAEWEKRLKASIRQARALPHPVLIDTLPDLYETLAYAISVPFRHAPQAKNTAASAHGGERARLTNYTAQAVISEYQLLRQALFDVLRLHDVHLNNDENSIINDRIDTIIRESVEAFELVQASLRERFVAALTHDLRNPLSTAMAAAELMKVSADKERTNALADHVLGSLHRMDGMIKDLLDVVVFQSGERLRLRLTHFEMLTLVQQTGEQLNVMHGKRIAVSGVSVRGYWDREVIKRAIENLIGNALKYSPPSTPVHVSVNACHERIVLNVHNQGNPIPPDQLETVFQVYRRTRAAKEGDKQGWGIGIPFVRAVAESHGGTVIVDSAPGRGTTFSIDMPTDARPFLDTLILEPDAD